MICGIVNISHGEWGWLGGKVHSARAGQAWVGGDSGLRLSLGLTWREVLSPGIHVGFTSKAWALPCSMCVCWSGHSGSLAAPPRSDPGRASVPVGSGRGEADPSWALSPVCPLCGQSHRRAPVGSWKHTSSPSPSPCGPVSMSVSVGLCVHVKYRTAAL